MKIVGYLLISLISIDENRHCKDIWCQLLQLLLFLSRLAPKVTYIKIKVPLVHGGHGMDISHFNS